MFQSSKMTILMYLPVERAMALLLVVDVVTFILTSIWPLEDARALHFIVAPHTFVFTSVGPVIDAY